MKFGKHIQKIQRPEWAGNYMSYKVLKKIINSIDNINEGKSSYSVTITAPNPPGTDENLSKEMLDLKTTFFFCLERELEKVNSFYLQKESEFKLRLQTLIEKKKIIQSKKNRIDDESLINLTSIFYQFQNDLTKLQEFVEINGTGFRKILKKWDKRSKSITKDMYLTRQVEIQPCFNRTVLNEISETVAIHYNELKQQIPKSSKFEKLSNETIKTAANANTSILDDQLYNYEKNIVKFILSGNTQEMKKSIIKVKSLLKNVHDENYFSRVFWRLCLECKYSLDNNTLDLQKENNNNNNNNNNQNHNQNQNIIKKKTITNIHNSIPKIFISNINDKSKVVKKIDIQDVIDEVNILINDIEPETIDFNYANDINDQTCLHLTAINSQVELMKFCVEHNANIYKTDIFGRVPLHYVAMDGNIECTKFLLKTSGNMISSPLSSKSTKSDEAHGEELDQDGYSPLLYSIVRGHAECLRIFLENCSSAVDFSSSLKNLHNPLSLACEYGHKNVVLILLQYGAKDEINADGFYPLHLACRSGHAEIAKILINHGSDVDVLDRDNGWTPIFYSCIDGYIDCVKVLLESHCKINITDENGWLPWTYALYHGHIRVAQLLSLNNNNNNNNSNNINNNKKKSYDDSNCSINNSYSCTSLLTNNEKMVDSEMNLRNKESSESVKIDKISQQTSIDIDNYNQNQNTKNICSNTLNQNDSTRNIQVNDKIAYNDLTQSSEHQCPSLLASIGVNKSVGSSMKMIEESIYSPTKNIHRNTDIDDENDDDKNDNDTFNNNSSNCISKGNKINSNKGKK